MQEQPGTPRSRLRDRDGLKSSYSPWVGTDKTAKTTGYVSFVSSSLRQIQKIGSVADPQTSPAPACGSRIVAPLPSTSGARGLTHLRHRSDTTPRAASSESSLGRRHPSPGPPLSANDGASDHNIILRIQPHQDFETASRRYAFRKRYSWRILGSIGEDGGIHNPRIPTHP
jgi:hypothetical protein